MKRELKIISKNQKKLVLKILKRKFILGKNKKFIGLRIKLGFEERNLKRSLPRNNWEK